MTGILKKINSIVKNRTTYRAGLLQAKAYRVLKIRTSEILSKYNISTVEWALLGLLHDNQSGLKASQLAQELGVEAPFVTALYSKLHKQDLVQSKTQPGDNRVKIILLTINGINFVKSTESHVSNYIRPLLKDVTLSEIASYVSVLERMIENSGNDKVPLQ